MSHYIRIYIAKSEFSSSIIIIAKYLLKRLQLYINAFHYKKIIHTRLRVPISISVHDAAILFINLQKLKN